MLLRKSIRQRLMASTLVGGMSLAAFAAVPLIVAAPGVAVAQAQSGSLRVAITGDNGLPVAGANVVVSSPDSLVSRSGETGADGRVRISGLDPATNYTVSVVADGYSPYSASNVAVVTGRDLSLTYVLSTPGSDATRVDDIVVTGRSLAAIDTTSATVSTTLTLGVVESLPTGRSYQSYLQLVPGVKPGSNPSSKSGVNSSVTGVTGASSDNIYILDGVNVTDPVTGTFGANFNSEIIQEQQVITGGVPAEFEGGSGLISTVVTKSGSNEWHGSLNYYFQNDALVQEDKHGESAGFSTYDTAFTLGGPILKDRLWIFGSYQKKYREDEVMVPDTDEVQRVVTNEAEYGFAKLSWQITDDDRLTVSYFSDPTEISGSTSASTRNYRDNSQVQGGDKYKVDYTRNWGDLLLNAYWYKHESELTTLAADQSIRNNVNFRRGDTYTYEQANIGGAGSNTERYRNREEFGLKLEYYLETNFGTHTFKAGYTQSETQSVVNSLVPGGATYTSLGSQYAGTTFDQLAKSEFTSAVFSEDDRERIIAGIDAAPNRAALYDLIDDGDGVLTVDEISAITFSDTTGNPGNQINAYRSVRVADGPNDVRSEGKALYLQDTWTYDNWTVNAGVRAEEWTHIASNGEELFTFDWSVAPRLSVVYDLFGDGRSKVWAFAGRYYDPPRNDMTGFAGSLSGAVNEEQINIGGNWVTFRTRGGAQVLDSIFAPSTKTPYTDEYVLGYSTTFRRDIGLTVTATKRATRDIMEDYDLSVYSDPNGDGATGKAHPGSQFYIPYSYFGLSDAQIEAVNNHEINYVLGTLRGGKRDYWGYEITLQKFKTDNWQAMVSYTYNDAEGNTSSDSNAGVQGDFIYLDPRAPNTWGDTPGNIKHLFKAFGSYEFDFGLELAGVFNWNSGILYTPIDYLYGYVAGPRQEEATEVDGVTSTWLLPGFTGTGKGPSYYTFDVRASYDVELPYGEVELFLDVFNILNKQSATSVFTNRAGSADYDFGEANNWVAPRRAYLGVRYSF